MTLGSLFSGTGGFELAGVINGITPIWNSEIEPFAKRVTKARFPTVKHYGDISSLKGDELEPVDIITFGSPCQDLSIAGKRAGINEGARSNLFFEAIRIIKEMRESTNGKYPRFIVWENVPGAFSSSKGADFHAVLESICKIKDEAVSIPECKKWAKSGSIVGGGFSACWRTIDSQHFGVPQRRRRIYLIADFASECAAEILFECEGLRGDTSQSRETGQGTAETTANGTNEPIGIDPYNGSLTGNLSATLGENCGFSSGRNGVLSFQPGFTSRCGGHTYFNQSPTLTTQGNDNHPCVAFDICSEQANSWQSDNPHSGCYQTDKTRTLNTNGNRGNGAEVIVSTTTGNFMQTNENKAATLASRDYKDPQVLAIQGSMIGRDDKNGPQGSGVGETGFTLNTTDKHAVCYQDKVSSLTTELAHATGNQGEQGGQLIVEKDTEYIVRRITPQECELLQGFPQGWAFDVEITEPSDDDLAFWQDVFDTYCKLNNKKPKTINQIKKWLAEPVTDNNLYKLYGNSICLPCGVFVLAKVKELSVF